MDFLQKLVKSKGVYRELKFQNTYFLTIFLLEFTLSRRRRVYGDKIQGFLTLIVAVLFIGGIQLIFLGILGEYLGRTYIESKRRPIYLVKEKINF